MKTETTTTDKIKSICESHIQLFSSFIKPTIDNSRQYEANVRNTYKVARIKDTIDYITKWESNIGNQVFKTINSFAYSELCNHIDTFNKTELTSVLFTQELFETLVKHMIEWKIEYYSDELITRSVTSNSTHKLLNIEFEWILECKQENIKLHKELLKLTK